MSGGFSRIWGERTERERVVIALASILLALALAYAYAWLPVARERDRLLVRVPELRAEAQAMNDDIREIERLEAGARPSIELQAAIKQAAVASRIALSQRESAPQGAERVRIRIVSVRASHWFAWVAQLQSSHGVRLDSARMFALGEEDLMNVEAILTQAR